MYLDTSPWILSIQNLSHHTGNFTIYVYILNIIQFEGAGYEKE